MRRKRLDKILTTSSHSLSFPYLCSTQTLSQKITNFFLLFFSNAKEEEEEELSPILQHFLRRYNQTILSKNLDSPKCFQLYKFQNYLYVKKVLKNPKNYWVALSNKNVSVTIFPKSWLAPSSKNVVKMITTKKSVFRKKPFIPSSFFSAKMSQKTKKEQNFISLTLSHRNQPTMKWAQHSYRREGKLGQKERERERHTHTHSQKIGFGRQKEKRQKHKDRQTMGRNSAVITPSRFHPLNRDPKQKILHQEIVTDKSQFHTTKWFQRG